MTHTYNITGMTCNNCVAKVKTALLKLGDVEAAEVQLASPQATITMSKHIPTELLQKAIGHYTITDMDTAMNHGDGESTAKNSYYPIYLIFGYIAGITLLVQFVSGGFNLEVWMSHF